MVLALLVVFIITVVTSNVVLSVVAIEAVGGIIDDFLIIIK